MVQAGISGVTGDYINCSKHYLARLHTLVVEYIFVVHVRLEHVITGYC